MELIDLLDKSERRQVQVMFMLLERERTLTINEIADELDVYRNTIKDDLSLLKGNLMAFKDDLKLTVDKDEVSLETFGNITTLEVIYDFLHFAINYQILINVLENGTFEIPALASELSVSVATLSRRIKHINELLEEFDLNIKNGRLVGTEAQIRYFYYLLIWYGMPYHQTVATYQDKSVDDLITVLESDLKVVFSEQDRWKVHIWMHITKTRLRLKICDRNPVLNKGKRYRFKDDLYQVLHRDLSRYFSRYAFNYDGEEVTLFYLFMIASFTIDVRDEETFWISQQAKEQKYFIYELNDAIKKELQTKVILSNTSEYFQVLFDLYLYQVHTKIYYFKGFVYFFGQSGIKRLFGNFPDPVLLEFCDQLVESTFIRMDFNKKERALRHRQLLENYAALIYTAFRDLDIRLNIACDFPLESTLGTVFVDNMKFNTDVRIPGNWMIYNQNDLEEYDVIITNIKKKYDHFPKDKVFLVIAVEYAYDKERLNAFIQKNYREKLFKMVTD